MSIKTYSRTTDCCPSVWPSGLAAAAPALGAGHRDTGTEAPAAEAPAADGAADMGCRWLVHAPALQTQETAAVGATYLAANFRRVGTALRARPKTALTPASCTSC